MISQKEPFYENTKGMTAARTSTDKAWHLYLRAVQYSAVQEMSQPHPEEITNNTRKLADHHQRPATCPTSGDKMNLKSNCIYTINQPTVTPLHPQYSLWDSVGGGKAVWLPSAYIHICDLWYGENLYLNTRASKRGVMCPHYKYTQPFCWRAYYSGAPLCSWFMIEISPRLKCRQKRRVNNHIRRRCSAWNYAHATPYPPHKTDMKTCNFWWIYTACKSKVGTEHRSGSGDSGWL